MLGIEQITGFPVGVEFFALIVVWGLIWKGLALWKAAKASSKSWFIIILVLNTFGILEIIYIFAVKPRQKLNLSFKDKIDK